MSQGLFLVLSSAAAVAPVVLHRFQFNKNVNFATLVLVFPLSHFKALNSFKKNFLKR